MAPTLLPRTKRARSVQLRSVRGGGRKFFHSFRCDSAPSDQDAHQAARTRGNQERLGEEHLPAGRVSFAIPLCGSLPGSLSCSREERVIREKWVRRLSSVLIVGAGDR